MFNQAPSYGNPNGKVYGVIGELYYATDGVVYIKSAGDTLNTGWEIFGTSSGSAETAEECPSPRFYPSVDIKVPMMVYIGEEFWVTASAFQKCGDLNTMGVRWNGFGLQSWWNVTGSGESAVRYAKLTAPSTQGTMSLRVEAYDNYSPSSGSTGVSKIIDVYPSIVEPLTIFNGPREVYETQSYWVTASMVRRGSGSLNSMGLRLYNSGLAQTWDLNFATGSIGDVEFKNCVVRYSKVKATGSSNGDVMRVEGFDNFGTGSRTQWETVEILKIVEPHVRLEYPTEVGANEIFWVTAHVSQSGGNLNSAGLRVTGSGLVKWWDLSGTGENAIRQHAIRAPSSPQTMSIRLEGYGYAGNNLLGTTGQWKYITVSTSSVSTPTPIAPVVLAAPTVVLSGYPSYAYISSSFWVTSSAEQYSGSINSMGLRQTGSGLIGDWQGVDVYNPESKSIFYTYVMATSSISSTTMQLRIEAFGTGGFLGTTGNWITIPLVPVSPATVSLSMPTSVYEKSDFWITASISQPGGDLNSAGIRLGGYGLQAWYDLSGKGKSATRYYHAFALSSSFTTMSFRVEAQTNTAGVSGSTGDWVNINLVTSPGFV